MSERVLRQRAKRLLDLYRERGIRAAAAESCTGGMVAAALTAVPGSSDVFECSFVTYSNGAKQKLLGVPGTTLRRYGAVSAETAAAMARGALQRSGADCAVSITGVAGPSGGSKDKPVGLVHFAAVSRNGKTLALRRLFGNVGRQRVRELSALEALGLLARLVQEKSRRAA
jgi:nicotinamide-nucleotide amidase